MSSDELVSEMSRTCVCVCVCGCACQIPGFTLCWFFALRILSAFVLFSLPEFLDFILLGFGPFEWHTKSLDLFGATYLIGSELAF